MKVYDIIQESRLNEAPWWLKPFVGGAKAVSRKFASKVDKRSFEEASEELADIITAKMKSGRLDHAPNIKDAERYIDPALLAAKKAEGAEGEAWIQDMIYTAIKKAHEGASAGSGAAKAGSTAGSLFLTGVKTAINTLLAYEIFSNVDDVFNNPKNGYMTMMREHERWLKSGEQTPERIAQFQNAHRETLKIAVGRLAWQSPTLILGSALAVLKILSMLRTGTLTAIGLKKLAAGLNALGGFVSYSAKSALAGYLTFLNSDIPIIKADVDGDGIAESLRPLDAIKWWIVDDAFFVVGKFTGVVSDSIGKVTEQALILSYEELMEKYGLDINTGLSKVGAKPLPATVPGSKKSLGQSAPPAVTNTATKPSTTTSPPSSNSEVTGEFNSADWKQLKSGLYQNNKTGELLHPTEFENKSK